MTVIGGKYLNNIDRIKMYQDIKWTNEQMELLTKAFNHIDYLLLLCERERNESKINILSQAHQTIHDLVLCSNIKEILKDIPFDAGVTRTKLN